MSISIFKSIVGKHEVVSQWLLVGRNDSSLVHK
jgi:hypothetical protein